MDPKEPSIKETLLPIQRFKPKPGEKYDVRFLNMRLVFEKATESLKKFNEKLLSIQKGKGKDRMADFRKILPVGCLIEVTEANTQNWIGLTGRVIAHDGEDVRVQSTEGDYKKAGIHRNDLTFWWHGSRVRRIDIASSSDPALGTQEWNNYEEIAARLYDEERKAFGQRDIELISALQKDVKALRKKLDEKRVSLS